MRRAGAERHRRAQKTAQEGTTRGDVSSSAYYGCDYRNVNTVIYILGIAVSEKRPQAAHKATVLTNINVHTLVP